MIRYTLVCDERHEFEAWFASSSTYDAQTKRKQVICPQCGSVKVAKGVMAPNIASGSKAGSAVMKPVPDATMDLQGLIRKFREHVERTSDNVGDRFAEEARKIHYRKVESRGIHGSATGEEAKQLREEGVEFHPLPALPEEQN